MGGGDVGIIVTDSPLGMRRGGGVELCSFVGDSRLPIGIGRVVESFVGMLDVFEISPDLLVGVAVRGNDFVRNDGGVARKLVSIQGMVEEICIDWSLGLEFSMSPVPCESVVVGSEKKGFGD